MNDVPDDIRQRAEELVRQDSCSSSTCTFMHGCGCFDAIAEALMAERERCAKVALRFHKDEAGKRYQPFDVPAIIAHNIRVSPAKEGSP